jgi:hypothetical protein
MLLGVALFIGGGILWAPQSDPPLSTITVVLLVAGATLLFTGVTRAVGERRKSVALRDAAAEATIATGESVPDSDLTAQLARLVELHATGGLTNDEFTTAKAKLLA